MKKAAQILAFLSSMNPMCSETANLKQLQPQTKLFYTYNNQFLIFLFTLIAKIFTPVECLVRNQGPLFVGASQAQIKICWYFKGLTI